MPLKSLPTIAALEGSATSFRHATERLKMTWAKNGSFDHAFVDSITRTDTAVQRILADPGRDWHYTVQ